MKKLSTFVLFCTLLLLDVVPSLSQSLQLMPSSAVITARTNQTASETYIYVKNTSTTAKKIRVQRIIDSMAPQHTTSFCWGGTCYEPESNTSGIYTLQPGETTPQAFALTPRIENIYNAPGTSKITYVFYNADNPNDKATIQVTYVVATTTDIQPEVDLLSTTLSSSFPSPATDNARVTYAIASPYATASLEVYNLIGNVVYATPLQSARGTVSLPTMGMNSGMYFYALVVDGKKMATKKLIVKH